MADAKTVVFPTDFSELSMTGLAWAKRLADELGAVLHCIYVVEEPVVYSSLQMATVPLPSADELKEGAEKRMAKLAKEHLSDCDFPTQTNVLIGRPADAIVDYANGNDASMIVMSTHGYSGLKHVVLGSTTEAVLRHAECPVLAVPGRGD